MKTIIRISPHVVDTDHRIAEEKLPHLAVRMLTEAYSTNRGEDALLILQNGADGRPVYMTLGSKAPELAIGGRQVFAVFDPPESQEPVASFFDEGDALAWARVNTKDGAKINKIDATDKPAVRVAVVVLIVKKGLVLMGKLKNGLYVLPEGSLEVGESVSSAAKRAAKTTIGLDIDNISISREAPYVSTYIAKAGQHFLSLVVVAQYAGGKPQIVDPLWTSFGWFDGEKPPSPLILTVQQIIDLTERNKPPAPLASSKPESLVAKMTTGRATAKKIGRPKKR